MTTEKKQRITVSLSRGTTRKLKTITRKRGVSISELAAEQLNKLFQGEDHYERARKNAMRSLRKGFHLRAVPIDRDSLHERKR